MLPQQTRAPNGDSPFRCDRDSQTRTNATKSGTIINDASMCVRVDNKLSDDDGRVQVDAWIRNSGHEIVNSEANNYLLGGCPNNNIIRETNIKNLIDGTCEKDFVGDDLHSIPRVSESCCGFEAYGGLRGDCHRTTHAHNEIRVVESLLSVSEAEGAFSEFCGTEFYPVRKWIAEFEELSDSLGLSEFRKFVIAKRKLSGLAKLSLNTTNDVFN